MTHKPFKEYSAQVLSGANDVRKSIVQASKTTLVNNYLLHFSFSHCASLTLVSSRHDKQNKEKPLRIIKFTNNLTVGIQKKTFHLLLPVNIRRNKPFSE